MARFYGPDAGERLRERAFRGNTPPNTERRGRTATALFCENCGRETEILFEGEIEVEKTVMVRAYGYDARRKVAKPVRVKVGGKVCFRCRPPSNLEVQEILKR